jgi:hypothetical protein
MSDGFGEVYVDTRRQLCGVWNAPFGLLYPLDPAHDVDALTSHIADFFQRGRKELWWRNSTATSANPDYR